MSQTNNPDMIPTRPPMALKQQGIRLSQGDMLDFLRQPGVRECDIDSVLEGAIAKDQLEEELKNFKYLGLQV